MFGLIVTDSRAHGYISKEVSIHQIVYRNLNEFHCFYRKKDFFNLLPNVCDSKY